MALRDSSRPFIDSSLLEHLEQLLRLAEQDAGEALGLLGGLGDAVQQEGLGDLLDAVDDIVEARRELVDVPPVEGRDERPLDLVRELVADLVALVLERPDGVDPLLDPVVGRDQRLQLARRGEQVLAVGDEQLEEPLVLGHQSKW